MARKRSAAAQAREDALDAFYRAQEVYYEVMEASTAKQRIAIAQKALKISPLCADAHALLAGHAKPDSEEALGHWQRAVEAGREALGEEFEEFAGEFWGFIETRPYMRARFGLASALWLRGKREEAIDHFNAMLELNPGDNQGVRYVLAAWLLEAGRDEDLGALLKRYEGDGMAAWLWTTALAAFRRAGDDKDSRKLLTKAQKQNPHVLAYLLGEDLMPKTLPPYMGFGDTNEAIHYASEFRGGWTQTPGALDWLRANSAGKKKPEGAKPVRATPKSASAKTKPAKAGEANGAAR